MKKLLIFTLSLLCVLAPACKKVNGNDYCLMHDYVERTISEPECTKEGLLEKKCSLCGDTKTEPIPVKGHTLVDGICEICQEPCTHGEYEEKVKEEATCQKEGVMGLFCKFCGEEDETGETSIPKKTTHEYVGDTCKHCGKEKEEGWTGFY